MGSYLMLFIRNLGNTAYFVEFFSFTVIQNGIFATNKFHNSELCRQLKGRAGCEITDTYLGYLERNTLIIENADLQSVLIMETEPLMIQKKLYPQER